MSHIQRSTWFSFVLILWVLFPGNYYPFPCVSAEKSLGHPLGVLGETRMLLMSVTHNFLSGLHWK